MLLSTARALLSDTFSPLLKAELEKGLSFPAARAAALEKLGLDFTYEEGPGNHSWPYWDDKIQRVLEWLPIGKEEQ